LDALCRAQLLRDGIPYRRHSPADDY
jgi:hypothetical protein